MKAYQFIMYFLLTGDVIKKSFSVTPTFSVSFGTTTPPPVSLLSTSKNNPLWECSLCVCVCLRMSCSPSFHSISHNGQLIFFYSYNLIIMNCSFSTLQIICLLLVFHKMQQRLEQQCLLSLMQHQLLLPELSPRQLNYIHV